MTLPHVVSGDVARADEQNKLIDAVNAHTKQITDAGAIVGDHESRISDLESTTPAAYFGQWTDDGGGPGTLITHTGTGSPGELGIKITDIGVPVGNPSGCTMNAGTFTPTHAGKWSLCLATQYQGNDNASVRAVYLAVSASAHSPTGAKYGLIGGPGMHAQSTSVVIDLAENQAVSAYVAVWNESGSVTIHRGQGNLLTAVWVGP